MIVVEAKEKKKVHPGAEDRLNDWRPTADQTSLGRRAELLRSTRDFFHRLGFLEVETPVLSHDTVVDRHLDPFAVVVGQPPVSVIAPEPDRRMFLQTSPEFAMKRLLVAGSGPIFQICKAFREGEAGAWHNPEFTMLEWYDTRLDYPGGRRQLGELANTLLGGAGFREVTYQSAFLEATGLDPFHASESELTDRIRNSGEYAGELESVGVATIDRDWLLDWLMGNEVQPGLGLPDPTIVYDWPGSQAALAARRLESGVAIAERYELYAQGVELANGFHELADPNELLARAKCNNRLRENDGKARLPEESRLASAMREGLPASCGCAMGLDRVLMVKYRYQTIGEVIAFPFDRA